MENSTLRSMEITTSIIFTLYTGAMIIIPYSHSHAANVSKLTDLEIKYLIVRKTDPSDVIRKNSTISEDIIVS